MVITYFGAEAFKIQFGDTVLAFNPISKDATKDLKATRFGADVAFCSLKDPLFDGVENLTYKDKAPFAIFGPGEYEIKEVFIKGFPSKSSFGGSERINTIYSAKLEGMHLVFLGALGEKEMSANVRGELGEIDILFVPIGGEGVLSPSDAYKLAVGLDPKVVIPMHYDGLESVKDALGTFLKEAGAKPEKRDKLTIKPKDLIGKENEVVVLEKS